jgi:hypothetical protein
VDEEKFSFEVTRKKRSFSEKTERTIFSKLHFIQRMFFNKSSSQLFTSVPVEGCCDGSVKVSVDPDN